MVHATAWSGLCSWMVVAGGPRIHRQIFLLQVYCYRATLAGYTTIARVRESTSVEYTHVRDCISVDCVEHLLPL
jgi:hypothetical protein